MDIHTLHELVSGSGDGLRPDLARLFEERLRIERDPGVVVLPGHARLSQAGPSPAPREGISVPDNVLRLARPAAGQSGSLDVRTA